MKQNAVVIVDGIGAARFFSQQLHSRGIPCIHVRSHLMPNSAFDQGAYLDCYEEKNSVKTLLESISKEYEIPAVIAGLESGVDLAHFLAQELNLKRNSDHLVSARRNKYDMIEAVKGSGLAVAAHYKSTSLNNILSWARSHNQFPVVVKPLNSAGSDNVHICQTMADIESAFNLITSSKTMFGERTKGVLIQEYLSGDEFVVNLVSCNGQHHLIELRQYHKQTFNGRHLYDFEQLLDFSGDLQNTLTDYAKKVAAAVGIQYGPSHVEIIMTASGPKLVEIAARISGATNVEISNQALGYNVVDLTIDSYLSQINTINNKVIQRELIIDIATNQQGVIKAIPFKETVKQYNSVKSAYFKVDIGDSLAPTVSLTTSPIKLHLLHQDINQLLHDKDQLKHEAQQGFVV